MKNAVIASVISLVCLNVDAGVREQAKRMHDRIAGVPPSEDVLLEMAEDLKTGDYEAAASRAMSNPAFYNSTLKSWISPWTNREQDSFADLNDYTATVIGIVRDGVDYRQVLYGDILYVADDALGLPDYSNTNNSLYEQLEASGVPLNDALVQTTQSSISGIPAEATAGVMTSRAAAKSFFIAGTNRAMFRFTLLNHMCRDMEQMQDTTLPPDRIRQDVSRSPGGDARAFLNGCLTCHNGMDPMAQSFAYYDYVYDGDADPEALSGQIDYNEPGETDAETGTRVKAKYHINEANFPFGFVTPDDSWDNYWREGIHSNLGWDSSLAGSGNGAKSMGMEMAHSQAFAQCAVEKVFNLVCLRQPGDESDRTHIQSSLSVFESSGYDLKTVFAESANYCKGP